ncbi:MAG: 50S ribosomal protein L24 [bacterium]|nr:50S ribosomal protein L24 [bacterium]
MRIKKGDTIKMISGKDRGRTGKVLRTDPHKERVAIEGLNMIKKHLRPRKQGEKGQIATIPSLVHVSKVIIICSKCGKETRIGYGGTEGRKHRICKKCGSEI